MIIKFVTIIFVVVTVNADTNDVNTRPWPPTTQNKPPGKVVTLGSYKVHSDKITISGFSSGGSFAQQLQISHSSLFQGIAVYSHTYYKCGPGDAIERNYDEVCTTIYKFPNERLWNPERTRQIIDDYVRQGLIENTNHLRGKKLYVYTGTYNWLFTTDMSLRILNIYAPLIRNPAAIMTRVQPANLTLPSDTFGGSCEADSSNNFFIANCGLSGPHEALSFILGNFVRKPDPQRRLHLQPLESFNQREFFAGTNPGMDNVGFLYIPQSCRNGLNRCHLHVYFHGCTLGREFVSDNHIKQSGYLELAEENGIIMVFPQAQKILPENEIGCWDTYGLTGPLFATQKGAQVSVVKRMIDRILKPTTGISQIRESAYGNNAQSNQRYNSFTSWSGGHSRLNSWGQGQTQSKTRWARAITDSVSTLYTSPELLLFPATSLIMSHRLL